MTIHLDAETVLIAWLALSGLLIFIKGIIGSTREYTLFDSIFGAAEIAVMIWLVTVVAR